MFRHRTRLDQGSAALSLSLQCSRETRRCGPFLQLLALAWLLSTAKHGQDDDAPEAATADNSGDTVTTADISLWSLGQLRNAEVLEALQL